LIDLRNAPTERLEVVLHALQKLDVLMADIHAGPWLQPRTRTTRPADICALVAAEAIGMQAYAQAAAVSYDFDVCVHQHRAPARFMCDASHLSQVMKNVLLNAIKYAGRGGLVRLDSRREPGMLALEISDNGPGVPLLERQLIFQRGVRGSAGASASGSGLGLAVVRNILDAYGGTITVADSAIGGASFVIRLPGDTSCADACRTLRRQPWSASTQLR
jgi:signal transduction histidine kinase